jgi:hypothetical protein
LYWLTSIYKNKTEYYEIYVGEDEENLVTLDENLFM